MVVNENEKVSALFITGGFPDVIEDNLDRFSHGAVLVKSERVAYTAEFGSDFLGGKDSAMKIIS